MALVDMKDMLRHAYEHGYAVGAFDLVSLDFLEGIMAAAERARAPVILSLAEPHFEYFDFELIMPAVEAAARRASVPVAIHLDHGASLESAVRAIKLGCNSVMVDASHAGSPDSIARTRAVVEMAHACGVPVEGKLDCVAGVEDGDAERRPGEIAYTDAAEAKAFVERTGVDFLAVSMDTVHGCRQHKTKLDYQRLKQINEAAGIPLVIHGASGLSDDRHQGLIAGGVVKINHDAILTDAAGGRARGDAGTDRSSGYLGLTKGVREAVGAEVERCLHLWGSAGRAAEVLAQCRPWASVEHLIIYNVTNVSANEVQAMMAEGRRVLGAIPGVREVFTGEAVKQDAAYRYTWLVRFCHPAVIDSYREHPDHAAFADNLFRPIAGDRISIDFQTVETVFSIQNRRDATPGEKR